ncbi:hypothetical protein PanWU01x14_349940 [Parasponia andersonii]|uniref:Uncharacterized protein n=1 Tax=Parasponia andersonii TaxID=3476 RepID=A0A2P5AB37_PARAD|nr:hypothetical protein PanWU01x14_349940 [Parasponia andersonii]
MPIETPEWGATRKMTASGHYTTMYGTNPMHPHAHKAPIQPPCKMTPVWLCMGQIPMYPRTYEVPMWPPYKTAPARLHMGQILCVHILAKCPFRHPARRHLSGLLKQGEAYMTMWPQERGNTRAANT